MMDRLFGERRSCAEELKRITACIGEDTFRPPMKLSVIIPCFNELNTIDTVVAAVRNSPYDNKEIIIVNDFSTDGTREKKGNEIERKVDKVIYHESNRGKELL
jgi:glycosyltransferase involved in cell wall biosynthesis